MTKEKYIEKLNEDIEKLNKELEQATTQEQKEKIKRNLRLCEVLKWVRGDEAKELGRKVAKGLTKKYGADLWSLIPEDWVALHRLPEEKQREFKELHKKYAETVDFLAKTGTTGEAFRNELYKQVNVEKFYELQKEIDAVEFTSEEWEKIKELYILREKYIRESTEEIDHLRKEIERLKEKVRKQDLEIAKNPKALAKLTEAVIQNKGIRDEHFKGFIGESGEREAMWSMDTLTALVREKDLPFLGTGRKINPDQGELIPTPPKIAVSQAKNIDTIIVLLEKANKKRVKLGEEKTAMLEFYFRDYAKIRGYSDKEISRGGKFNNELRKDLISMGITRFILESKKKIIINNLYGIGIPKTKSQGKWGIWFNEPYASIILDSKRDYYPIILKAIGDKSTNDKKGYLYFFLKEVLRLSNNPGTGFRTQEKIATLLDNIKIGGRAKERPQEAFKVLAECINYVADNYENILTEVRFLKSSKDTPKIIKDLSIFKNIRYEQFKTDILRNLETDDIRETFISFNTIVLKEIGNRYQEREQIDYIEGDFLPG